MDGNRHLQRVEGGRARRKERQEGDVEGFLTEALLGSSDTSEGTARGGRGLTDGSLGLAPGFSVTLKEALSVRWQGSPPTEGRTQYNGRMQWLMMVFQKLDHESRKQNVHLM